MTEDPDIMVIGSQNGLGKTSTLECCSLLLSTLTTSQEQWRFQIPELRSWPVHLPDLLVRAGAEQIELDGEISLGSLQFSVSFHLTRRGHVKIHGEKLEEAQKAFDVAGKRKSHESIGEDLIRVISGMSTDPVLTDSFLFFHSYRKVQEGNPELGMMVDEPSYDSPYRPSHWRRRYNFSVSRFKMIILKSLMQQADLFELSEAKNLNTAIAHAIAQLNELLKFYVGGTISKLRPREDNTVEFRIHPNKGGDSFTFDGLSSGQKEIISTLFLVWYYTQERPSVVLIDEPELHLNAQWHRSFVNKLLDLAPHNQYIVATHSVDVMDSVEKDRRLLLEA
ncbi:MAG: hypothetical protein TH68_05690 [Candidatus Synechococcus spongiarum 142]|uniref:ATPase AAA-type core domain-containing protein n=1 Tax=Candidatus Synechococcus spongiarum 142 TaxID=1608213 RepID=A0A6N3X4C9_9SYNE|nr:MAG: hypothetical protein TH68_05690 [Candidatus Synechococcus spongiarum 142]